MQKLKLKHPPVEDRRRRVKELKGDLRLLARAKTLLQVAQSLATLRAGLTSTANSFGIEMKKLPSGSARQIKLAFGRDKDMLLRQMPGRAPYNSLKTAILAYAETHRRFTVDDLHAALAMGNGITTSRRSLAANLYALAKAKEVRRRRHGERGPNGSPAVYSRVRRR